MHLCVGARRRPRDLWRTLPRRPRDARRVHHSNGEGACGAVHRSPLFLRTVRNAKFLHVIDPRQATEVTFPLAISRPDEGGVAVSCVVTDAVGTLFAKISLLLEEVEG